MLRGSNSGKKPTHRVKRPSSSKKGACYVYVYYSLNVPIYVGKGTGGRVRHHINRALVKKPEKSRFHRRLGRMLRSGRHPEIMVHTENLSEKSALGLEIKLIKKFGRLGIDTDGTLLNVAPGGKRPVSNLGKRFLNRKSPTTKGRPGKKWSVKKRRRHSKIMRTVMSDPKIRKKISRGKTGKPGRKLTVKDKAAVSRAQNGVRSKAKSLSKMGRKNPMFGWKWFNNGKRSSLFDPAKTIPKEWSLGRKLREAA